MRLYLGVDATEAINADIIITLTFIQLQILIDCLSLTIQISHYKTPTNNNHCQAS